jgi:hypothetical protein
MYFEAPGMKTGVHYIAPPYFLGFSYFTFLPLYIFDFYYKKFVMRLQKKNKKKVVRLQKNVMSWNLVLFHIRLDVLLLYITFSTFTTKKCNVFKEDYKRMYLQLHFRLFTTKIVMRLQKRMYLHYIFDFWLQRM